MANMSIGGYTLDSNPSSLTVIKAAKSCAVVRTLGGAAFFNWGTVLPGTPIEARWDKMLETEFAAIDDMMDADGTVVLDPQDGSGSTFNVWLVSFDGDYYLEISDGTDANVFRQNVVLQIVIESEVS